MRRFGRDRLRDRRTGRVGTPSMLARVTYKVLLVCTLSLGVQTALAQHSVVANFDTAAVREITGRVTAFRLTKRSIAANSREPECADATGR